MRIIINAKGMIDHWLSEDEDETLLGRALGAVQSDIRKKWFHVSNTIHYLFLGFQGWLYHMELITRPKRFMGTSDTDIAEEILWMMLEDRCHIGWDWYWDRPF